MWYTQISGIWQSVWFEYVPKNGIYDLNVRTNQKDLYLHLLTEAKEICITLQDEHGESLFLHGVVDQGYFEDAIFVPQNPKAYDHDIC